MASDNKRQKVYPTTILVPVKYLTHAQLSWLGLLPPLLWAFAFPSLWLLITAVAVGAQYPATIPGQLTHSLLFLIGNAIVFAFLPQVPSRGSARHLAAAAAKVLVPLALVEVHLRLLVGSGFAVFAALVVGAGAEEIVFRFLLPGRCIAVLARRYTGNWARLCGFVIAQVAFAVSHLVLSIVTTAPAPSSLELARLTAAGLLLQVLQLTFGTGAAIGAHAAVNIVLVLGTYVPSLSPSVHPVALLNAGGLLLVWAADRTLRRNCAVDPSTPVSR